MKRLLFLAAILMAGTGVWAETVGYIDADGQPKTADAAIVTSSNDLVIWGTAGETTWYAVTGTSVQLLQGAVCSGDVRLILADGADITADSNEYRGPGIAVSGTGNSLTVYGQTEQSGRLTAVGRHGAGIGGNDRQDGSHITINGGTVTATAWYGAGIGGGNEGDGFDITINGGTVTAISQSLGAGIGGGDGGYGSDITVNGGTVTATGAMHAAGIGGGEGQDDDGEVGAGTGITINGGMVTATAGDGAAGIGGGYYGDGTDITINGGTVTATAGNGAAGIGAGSGVEESNRGIRNGGYIYLLGGTVTANGGSGGSGIGCGWYGRSYCIYADPYVIVKAGSSENPTDEIATSSTARTEISSSLAGKRYVTAEKDLTALKNNAIAEITSASQGIKDTELNNWIDAAIHDIQKGSLEAEPSIDDIKDQILYMINLFQNGKNEGKAEALGTLGTKQNGPAVIITDKDDNEIILYSPKSVEYIKVNEE